MKIKIALAGQTISLFCLVARFSLQEEKPLNVVLRAISRPSLPNGETLGKSGL